jgi:hypothetical protein
MREDVFVDVAAVFGSGCIKTWPPDSSGSQRTKTPRLKNLREELARETIEILGASKLTTR